MWLTGVIGLIFRMKNLTNAIQNIKEDSPS